MNIQKIALGGGCFWCTEAIFQVLQGVHRVESGYMGGLVENPTYNQVCTGKTGHAEVVEIAFDTDKISLQELIYIFFKTHDPTTLNRQGGDAGTQYRSVIFFYNDEQRKAAKEIIKELTAQNVYDAPIVTAISSATAFYKADDSHQNYYNNHQWQPYCSVVIHPKLNKLLKEYTVKIKPELL